MHNVSFINMMIPPPPWIMEDDGVHYTTLHLSIKNGNLFYGENKSNIRQKEWRQQKKRGGGLQVRNSTCFLYFPAY